MNYFYSFIEFFVFLVLLLLKSKFSDFISHYSSFVILIFRVLNRAIIISISLIFPSLVPNHGSTSLSKILIYYFDMSKTKTLLDQIFIN